MAEGDEEPVSAFLFDEVAELRARVAELEKVLKAVKDTIDNSEHWWMDKHFESCGIDEVLSPQKENAPRT